MRGKGSLWVFAAFLGLISTNTLLAQEAQNGQVYAGVEKDGKWGFIDTLGKVKIPFTMDMVHGFSEGLSAVKYGRTWGYINKKGTFVIKPVFVEANSFHDNHARVTFFEPRDKSTYNGYISRLGGVVILLEFFENGGDFHDGLVQIRSADLNGGAIGFKDTTDKWVIKPHYDGATDFHEGKASIALGKYWGFIDEENNMTVFPKYSEAWPYQEGLAYVKDSSATSFLNKKGKVAFSVNYEEVDLVMQEGMICFKDKGKIGFMNAKGKVVIKPTFHGEYLSRFQGGLAPMHGENGKVGFIDKTGNFVIPPQFDDAQLFFNNLAVAKKDGKYGYINKKGEWVIPAIYDRAQEFEATDY